MTTQLGRPRQKRRGATLWAASLVTTALIASTLIATVGPAPSADATGASDGAVSGTVFRNLTSTGWKSPGNAASPAALPVAGVTATAYDAQGDVVGSAVSGSSGAYSISVVDAFSDELRVEFSNWPTTLEPGHAAQGTAPTPVPAANDTSVQFVTLGAGGAATGVDFGLVKPDEVTQPNVPIATAVQSAGVRTGNSAQLPAIVAQPWGLDGEAPASTNAISTVAKFTQIGSVWGMAYAPKSNDLLVAATLKRMSGLGPLGLGGIYRTQDVLLPNGSVNASAATAGWFSFAGLPVSNAGNVALDIGAAPTPATRNLGNSGTARRDTEAFAKAGRVGIGAIATSPDGSRLFASNLYDGDVYAVDISNPDVAPSSAYRIATPVGSAQAIWAVEVHGDRLYIGYVDTGDTPAGAADPGKSAASKGMKAYVASTPIAGILDPAAPASAWATELTVDLGYTKGSNIQNWTAESGKKFDVEFPQMTRWNSWTNVWRWSGGNVAKKGENLGQHLHQYPQAILSSIAFDVDGYLNLGFLDRTSVQSGNRSLAATAPENELWTSISDGDVLVAAPRNVATAVAGCPPLNLTENYVLECHGKVGDRAVRTANTVPDGQKPTYNDNEGPGGGEFYNDRRDLGTEKSAGAQNHNEIALGSVTSYPGAREVATTAMDPRSQAYNTGLMWFDERSGAASRGIDLVPSGGGGTGKTSFQKSGGLGATALLAVEAPVEIGNRVWLDADLNGRQDADEPAINGAIVELWTADADGLPVDKIASRTTAEVDGQAGTYYFRTDDADVVAANNAHPFLANGSYVLVFQAGSTLSLAGPNARNAGFAGLAWSDLQRTSAQVQVAATPSNGGTSETNDSNPDVTSGQFAFTLGGPGENNHSYDSGWFAANNYELSKAFSPSTVSLPADASYDFTVVSAKNFRGEDRLASGGAGAPSDPQVTDIDLTLSSPTWTRTSAEALPLGYQLVLEERNAPAGSVSWSSAVTGDPARGQVTIIPQGGAQASALLTATNSFGRFEVVKTVAGTAATQVSDDVEFVLEYSLDGGATVLPGTMTQATPFALDPLPLGTTVKFREPTPIVTDPVLAGITWGTPEWTQVTGLTGPDADGWYSYTLTAARPTISLSLSNSAEPTLGGFSILKAREDGEPLPDATFSFQYKVGASGAPVSLGPIAAGATVSSSNTIVYGSTVFVREIAPLDTTDVRWAQPSWSGLPQGATGPDANGWYSFVFTPDPLAPLTLTAKNRADQKYGEFSVSKTVATTGTPDVADQTFGFRYRTAPKPVGGAAPTFGAESGFELTAGATWPGPGPLPVGTIVEVREQQPENTATTAWRTPSWLLDGGAVTVVNGWTRFTVKETTAPAVTAVQITNHADELLGLTLQKTFVGTGLEQVVGLDFPVDVKIAGRADERITLSGDGVPWQGPDDLLAGTVVMVKEVQPLPVVAGIKWGTPSWNAGAGITLSIDADGWTVFTVTSDSQGAALTLTNAPSALGQFEVKKTLITNGDPVVPTEYTIEYTLDGGTPQTITLDAEETSAPVTDLDLGTVVKVRELDSAAQPNVQWDRAWTIAGAAATPDGDGWVTFTVADMSRVSLEVTNTATELFGGFQVTKSVDGAGERLVPADTTFWFSYTLDGGEAQLLSATRATASTLIDHLPHGTVVTIEEVLFPVIPGVSFSASPGWTLDGVDVSSPVTFTIDAEQQTVELAVKNTAEEVFGSFELTKEITGDAAGRIPDTASFTVEYSVDDGETWLALDEITKQKLTVSSPDFLVGTTVLLRELAPADGVGFEWGAPVFSVDGVVQGTSAQFTISQEGASMTVGLENPSLPRDGSFDVQKSVAGVLTLDDEAFSDVVFTANWSGGGRSGVIEMTAANGWKGSPDGAPFPEGTVIELTEGPVTGLPSRVQFDGYGWLDDTPGVTMSPDGTTATLTVVASETSHLRLENRFTPLTGDFSVEKSVSGAFTLDDEELSSQVFTVDYTVSTGERGTLLLSEETGWKAIVDKEFPKDSTVTVTEVAVEQGSLPPNVQWSGYRWLQSDDYVVSKDGLRATAVVTENATLAFKLENSFTDLHGSFAVQKVVAGPFALTDPELSGLSFGAAYSTSTGESGTLDLNAANGWTAAGAELPAGTEVAVTEVTPTGLPLGINWDGYRWLDAAGVTISEDGKTASFVVDDETPVLRLTMENAFSPVTNNFSVQKIVAGDYALTSPELAGLSFTAPYTTSTGVSGTLTLDQAGHWVDAPADGFPVGTTVTITEADVEGLPEHVRWAGHRWLVGGGYAVSADGKTATFTVETERARPDLKLTLENTFTVLQGGFTLTKQVTGDAAEKVPDELEFTAEYSLDGGESWAVLPAMTKGAVVSGPGDIRIGTTVLIRENTPPAVPGVTWGAPAFSGTGITPGVGGAPASFVVGSAATPVAVTLSNPTSPANGQFQVTKAITGAGASLLEGEPVFTVKYRYDGQDVPGEFTITAGQLASSEPIPSGTVVTITELVPQGGLVDGASWGTPVFVDEHGTVLKNGATITIDTGTVLALRLENPTVPPLPPLGVDGLQAVGQASS